MFYGKKIVSSNILNLFCIFSIFLLSSKDESFFAKKEKRIKIQIRCKKHICATTL